MAARGQNDSITEQVSAPTEANDDESLSQKKALAYKPSHGARDAKGKYDKYTRGKLTK